MINQNYRSEAHRIRAESRAKLTEIRLARREQRRSYNANTLDTKQDARTTETDSVDATDRTSDHVLDQMHPQATENQDDIDVKQDESQTHMDARDVLTEADDPLEQYAAQNTHCAPTTPLNEAEAPLPEQEAQQVDCSAGTVAEAAPDSALAPDVDQTHESELMQLPGVAEGLIWMLEKCGVRTLADLSVVDPDDLTKQLGVVGQIVNVSVWIEFAKEKIDHWH